MIGSANARICRTLSSSARMIRNTAAASRLSRSRVDRKLSTATWSSAGTCAVSWPIGTGSPGGRPNSAYVRSVHSTSPVSRFSSQPPIRPSRCAWCSSPPSRSSSSARCQAMTTPSYSRVMRTSSIGVSVWSPTGVLNTAPETRCGPAAGQHPDRLVEQAAGQRGARVHLEQRAAGDVRGRAAGRIAEPLAEVADQEVGDLAAVSRDRLGVHGAAQQPVQQAERPGRTLVRGQPAGAQPGADGLRAHLGQRAELAAQRAG